ncbi:MAG TPA: carbamoyltransferase N-terminal domain-containing protein [Methylomirabilota bacterium]
MSQNSHRMVIRHHPVIGHLFVPNMTARIPHERGAYFVRTNAQGFRSDIEFRSERGSSPRILFFGDSITAGDGCSNEERFSELVGQALGAEVYNYALSGSGTDQQVLIFETFAREVAADLLVLCTPAENIERIKVTHRLSVDRATGQQVLVPKPYFSLEGSELRLHQVPVPIDRPVASSANGKSYQSATSHREANPGLQWVFSLADKIQSRAGWRRLANLISPQGAGGNSRLRSLLLRCSGFQPHHDYADEERPACRLMRAILQRFFAAAAPVPVLVVPLPSSYFYLHGLQPIYQRFFNRLADGPRGIHVMDATTPLTRLDYETRKKLRFERDSHFSPLGHRKVAELITQTIVDRNLLARRQGPRPSVTLSPRPAAARPTYVLGLSCFYHNSAACLVKDGHIVAAAEEERFTRLKNDRRFPQYAANYCLEEGGIQPTDLAAVVYYDNAPLTFERLLRTLVEISPEGEAAWQRMMPTWSRYKLHLPGLIRESLRYDGLVLQEIHHRSHAASAFYPSPFERAAILTIDGVGEWGTASIASGHGSQITLLKEMRFPHSLGLLYSAFTQFTGFQVNEGEYKMMGLAPYGQPTYLDTILNHLVDVKEDGSVELNMKYFAFLSEPTMTNEAFAELFGGPARPSKERITQREMDIARSAQAVTELAILRMAAHAHRLTGEKNLCLAGGVALNCVANGRVLREGPFQNLWIQPAAGDAGSALGAALDAYHTYFGGARVVGPSGRSAQGGSFLGPAFSDDEIRAFLDTNGCVYRKLAPEERPHVLAGHVESGRVVGHFSGRTEFGPRSLGARSIVGDARNREMQVTLNLKIKYRESFRPFAPTVLAERVSEYFELDRESPYMLIVAPVKKSRWLTFERGQETDLLAIVRRPRSDIPAITHVDYSARIQTLLREEHPQFYDLIKAFEDRTGYGVVVNTSFNVQGEPIVCTPYDAYRCFMRTEMDVLALGDYLLLKGDQPPWPKEPNSAAERRAPAAALEPAFLEDLRQIYARTFRPAAERIRSNGYVPMRLPFKRRTSLWDDFSSPQTRAAIFSIPTDIADFKDPARAARAITSFWSPGEVTDALRPVVERLLAAGSRQRPDQIPEEEVSESMYVMF